MEIRDAVPGDEIAACDVLRRSIVELCQADHRGDNKLLNQWLGNKTPEMIATWITRRDAAMLLAIENNVVLAVGMVTISGEVMLNYVAPDARFRGVSRAMLSALETRALEFGCAVVNLTSTLTAHRFYCSAGYDERGRLERDDGWVVYPMVKQLIVGPAVASTS